MIRDDPQQAVHFISLHWSQASRGEAAPAIQLWVDEQKAIASKKEPLSQKQLLKNNTQCMDQRTAHQPEHLVRGKATAEAEEVSPAKAAGIVVCKWQCCVLIGKCYVFDCGGTYVSKVISGLSETQS